MGPKLKPGLSRNGKEAYGNQLRPNQSSYSDPINPAVATVLQIEAGGPSPSRRLWNDWFRCMARAVGRVGVPNSQRS